MNNTERIVIRELVKSLRDSSEKNWNYGDVEQWAKFGRRMMNTIDTVVPVLPVEFIIESLTKLGESPSILYDDDGHFAVESNGFQSVPMDDDGEMIDDLYPNGDVSMSFYVEKKKWFGTIREALSYYLKYDEK